MAAKIPAAGVDLDGAITVNESSADVDFRVESNGKANMFFVDGGNDRIGINTTGQANHMVNIEDVTGNGGGTLGLSCPTSGTSDNCGRLHFGNATDPVVAAIFGIADGANDAGALTFRTEATGAALEEALRIDSNRKLATNGETASDTGEGGLCLNQAANDDVILSFKSSDVNAGGGVSGLQSDTYAAYKKLSGSAGGLLTQIQSEGVDCHETRALIAEGTTNTTKSTSANAPIMFKSAENHSGGVRALSNAGTNSNLFIIADHTTRRFIFDSEGDLHSDSSNTTFDSYEDAHLVRAFDLSHGRGVIDSKFDEFVKYKHEDLANIGLVGREEDGTPNHFINICGFQRLHNGAIWQQYEKHQRLAEAVYEMAKEALGKDKADAILEKHDIKLLN